MGITLTGTVLGLEGEVFRRWTVVRIVQQCEYTWCHWTVQLNMVKIGCFILCDFCHNKKNLNGLFSSQSYFQGWLTKLTLFQFSSISPRSGHLLSPVFLWLPNILQASHHNYEWHCGDSDLHWVRAQVAGHLCVTGSEATIADQLDQWTVTYPEGRPTVAWQLQSPSDLLSSQSTEES